MKNILQLNETVVSLLKKIAMSPAKIQNGLADYAKIRILRRKKTII